MNLLKGIQDKTDVVNSYKNITVLNSIITHIQRAETYLNRGREEQEEDYFTDVIYRTNQAYEGILKESYKVFTGHDPSSKPLYKIEEYFDQNDIFNKRVLDLFTNYRINWRNVSTHDYNLFFSEDEAYLAIVSVSSFIYILLNQIIEKLSYNEEKEIIQKEKPLKDQIAQYENLDFFNQINEILSRFKLNREKKDKQTEIEFIGAIEAFLEFNDPSLVIYREPQFWQKSTLFTPDLIVEKNNHKIYIEVKKEITEKTLNSNAKRLNRYLEQEIVEKMILITTSKVIGLKEKFMNRIEKSENVNIIIIETN
ncbi:MAG: hypothetical protein ACFFDF_17215 [Candidatus Odinarchaeota archaeon]